MDEVPATEGFAPDIAAKLRTYVYLLVDPRTGRPFSAGRGRSDRCFRHVRAAHGGDDEAKFPQLDRVRQIEAAGGRVRIDILRYGLSSDEAKLVEEVAIDALGLATSSAADRQRVPAAMLRSTLAKPAKFKRAHQVVLLRVGAAAGGGAADDGAEAVAGEISERLRHGWRIGRRWIEPDSPRSPRWAVLVVGDLVHAVYRIAGWKPAGSPGGDGGPGAGTRYSFVGEHDPDLEKRYLGRNVAAYLGPGSQSPVTYVWCGPHWVNTPH